MFRQDANRPLPPESEIAIALATFRAPGSLCYLHFYETNQGLSATISFNPVLHSGDFGDIELTLRNASLDIRSEKFNANCHWDSDVVELTKQFTFVMEDLEGSGEGAGITSAHSLDSSLEAKAGFSLLGLKLGGVGGVKSGSKREVKRDSSRAKHKKTTYNESRINLNRIQQKFTINFGAHPGSNLAQLNSGLSRFSLLDLGEIKDFSLENLFAEIRLKLDDRAAPVSHAFQISHASGHWRNLVESENKKIVSEILISKFFLPLHQPIVAWPLAEHQSATPNTTDIVREISAVIEAKTDNFIELSKLANLDPSVDFIGADLSNADLRNLNLSRFNFRGASLYHALVNGAKLPKSANIDQTDLTLPSLPHLAVFVGRQTEEASRDILENINPIIISATDIQQKINDARDTRARALHSAASRERKGPSDHIPLFEFDEFHLEDRRIQNVVIFASPVNRFDIDIILAVQSKLEQSGVRHFSFVDVGPLNSLGKNPRNQLGYLYNSHWRDVMISVGGAPMLSTKDFYSAIDATIHESMHMREMVGLLIASKLSVSKSRMSPSHSQATGTASGNTPFLFSWSDQSSPMTVLLQNWPMQEACYRCSPNSRAVIFCAENIYNRRDFDSSRTYLPNIETSVRTFEGRADLDSMYYVLADESSSLWRIIDN